jgi:hypothetical protein
MSEQLLIDYSPSSWHEWVRLILAESIEWTLLFVVFGALSALASGHVYQSPLGPVSGDLVNIGFIFTLLQIMLWWLVEGIIEAVSAWAQWLTPMRAIVCGLAVGALLWLCA